MLNKQCVELAEVSKKIDLMSIRLNEPSASPQPHTSISKMFEEHITSEFA